MTQNPVDVREKKVADMGETENWFFPGPVHLRLRDQSILKFAAGPQGVPVSLPEEEREILKRYGAKPIEPTSKQASSATKTPVVAPVKAEGTSDKAAKSEGSSEAEKKPKEVNK